VRLAAGAFLYIASRGGDRSAGPAECRGGLRRRAMLASCSLMGRVRIGLLVACGLLAGSGARADALAAVQLLRAGGCGGVMRLAPPLRRNVLLDRTARAWATGSALPTAATSNGFDSRTTSGVHVQGSERTVLETLRRTECRSIMPQNLREVGAYETA